MPNRTVSFKAALAALLFWPTFAIASQSAEHYDIQSDRRASRPPEVKWTEPATPEIILKAFLGLPFRTDGLATSDGHWATWNHLEKYFKNPGMNCSGFTLTAARFLLNEDFKAQDVRNDRNNDSGPDSVCGEDWDFGLDVILNLTKNHPYRLIPTPTGPTLDLTQSRRPVGWGVDLHSPELETTIKEFRADRLYFFVLSKPDHRFKCGLSYYHTGLIKPETNGSVWLYQATLKAGVHRLNLANPTSLANLRHHFPKTKNGGERRIFFIETTPYLTHDTAPKPDLPNHTFDSDIQDSALN